ncbi:Baculoviral IAP repeat-containing protein 7-B [Acanthisitta chloris]|uniref:RING-type E3 ubiquitin transferase n=1 Tax=Acanthisitta chloris TaxID=57068 RepID=A0A091MU24_9PASS|nr:Baculoviral IAP repeat-containing protein 7-B [Acanthisitta chloris]
MGDATPAEETELRAACCQLFDSSMRSVARRLRTFQRWPQNSPVSAQELVEAGFFFVGPSDEVQCFCCGGVLKDWRPGDCPIMEHLNFFPSCKYICGEDVGNQNMFSLEGIFDTVDGQLLSVLQGIVSEDTALLSQPEYPEMIREEMRLSTFQNWPQHTNMQPEQLARAGFFYTGEDDVVRCFHCDGGVRNWSYGDDPWSEHAKWYPGCEFLLQSKGRVFVNSVRATFSTTLLTPSQLSAEEQLRRLREERTCKVCMDRDVSVVFVPCGHLVACGECALNLRLCPICRAVIQGSVRTFMS